MEIIKLGLDELKPYEKNAKRHPEKQIEQIKKSIEQFGNNDPIAVWGDDNTIVEGHGRYIALKELGYTEAECIRLDHLTDEERKAYTLAHNKLTMNSDFDFEILDEELKDIIDIDMSEFGFDGLLEEEDELQDVEEDEVPEEVETRCKLGDLWILGNNRLICGDSTDVAVIDRLMDGVNADCVFTDPPYGMKKESEGVLNDNLNYDDLLDFNRQWIPLTFGALKDNGSWYCWGIDEPLMDIYSNILKPMQKENKITFRNLITWKKENDNPTMLFNGACSSNNRSYYTNEKCLFVMCGVQCLDLNADQYWEEYEPIRKYLYDERMKCGWDVPTMKTIAGHSDKSRDHWTGKSQFNLPTKEVYEKFQKWAKDHNVKAFEKEYEQLRKEYEQLRKEYEQLRAYFDGTKDQCIDVWVHDVTSQSEREHTGGHATPKPIALCSRAIKSSSREGEIVLDVFGGSGSTLIACEQLNRKCYMAELDPKYVSVILQRYINFKGSDADVFLLKDGKKIPYSKVNS